MPIKIVILTSDTLQLLEKMGTRIKRARLRRNISVDMIVRQIGISENTYYAIEKGVASVSIGAYAAVLTVLELDKDIELIAMDEEGKKKFREQSLIRRERVSRCKN